MLYALITSLSDLNPSQWLLEELERWINWQNPASQDHMRQYFGSFWVSEVYKSEFWSSNL